MNTARLRKIDEEGNFLPYPGITVICPLRTDISAYHKAMRHHLRENGCSILPISSMHMTLRNLWTAKKFNSVKEYEEHLERSLPALRELQKGLNGCTSVQMGVFRNYCKGLELIPDDEDDMEMLHQNEHKFDVACRKIGQGPFERVKKHMTLGYAIPGKPHHSCGDPPPFHLLPEVLMFGRPIVCKFDDMKGYTPLFPD